MSAGHGVAALEAAHLHGPAVERWKPGQVIRMSGSRVGKVIEVRPTEGGAEIIVETPEGRHRGFKHVPDGWHPLYQTRLPAAEWTLTVLADPGEPHYPICNECHQPWPCETHDTRLNARRAAYDAEELLRLETEKPWMCEATETVTVLGGEGFVQQERVCGRRFATFRGLQQHRRRHSV